MRILLISVDFPPHRDGVSVLSYHYARRLADHHHDVMVVAPKAPNDSAVDRLAPFTTVRFPGYSWGLGRFMPFALCVLKAVAQHRPNLILAMNIGYGGLMSLPLSYFARCQYVTVAYAYEFMKFQHNALLRRVYNTIYRRSLFTIAISQYTKDRLIRFGVSEKRIKVIHPGIQTQTAFDPKAEPGAVEGSRPLPFPVIGTCGRLIRRKGVDLVIRAIPGIARRFPEIRYLVAGEGPMKNELVRLANECRVRDRVHFLGSISDIERADFYRSLDLFVMPARNERASGHVEGFGIVFLEAALQGVPSLSTQTGGIPEAIQDGVTGRLVQGESASSVTRAILQLLEDRDKLKQMGIAARDRAVRDFNWDTQIDRLRQWIPSTAAHQDESTATE